jgi:hypothetical protein
MLGKRHCGNLRFAARAPGLGLVDPDDSPRARRSGSRRRTGEDGNGQPGAQSSHRERSRSGHSGQEGANLALSAAREREGE